MMPPMQIFVGQVSVVIPMYNSEKTIVDVLESIRKQTRLDYVKQIIVVNDGSTDNSLAVVRNYAEMHKDLPIEVVDQENGGVSVARNRGMERATGEWIAFLDSDDEWFPSKLECQVQVLSDNPEIDFLGANWVDYPQRFLGKKLCDFTRITLKMLLIKNIPQLSTAIMRRRILEEIGGFDETRRYAEDGQYCLKIVEKFQYYYLPQQVVCYGKGKRGFGDGGLSGNLKDMNDGMFENLEEVYDRGSISFGFYCLMWVFYWIKYWKRVLICKVR